MGSYQWFSNGFAMSFDREIYNQSVKGERKIDKNQSIIYEFEKI